MNEAKLTAEPHKGFSPKREQWLLLLLVPLIVWGIVFACYPLIVEDIKPKILYNIAEGLNPLRAPLYTAIITGFLLIEFFSASSKKSFWKVSLRNGDRERYLSEAGITCWQLGYANLLFGVIPSIIGTIAPFLVGTVLYIIPSLRHGKRPIWQPRSYILAIGAFLLFDLYTLLWAHDRSVALEWWIREASLLPPLFLLLMYPPRPQDIRLFMRNTLRITYLYLVSIVAVYIVVCWATDHSLAVAFSFEKLYFLFDGVRVSGSVVHSPFGFSHYTYLGITMLCPILYNLLERGEARTKDNLLLGGCIVGFFCFIFIFQSRVLMLVLGSGGMLGLLYFVTYLIFPSKGALWKRLALGLSVIVAASLLLIFCKPSLFNYLFDQHRLNLFKTALMYLKEDPLWGYGLGSAEALISPFYQGEYATHFHNQYLLCYVEGGIISLLLWVMIFFTYLRYALRSRNYAAFVLGGIMLIVMTIEVITCLSQYLIAMGMMAAFLISTHQLPQKK